jgi:1-acyl-sn-glycerol-3-phosphate acyltransferase
LPVFTSEARGKDRLPEGAFIIAAKHQSWGDGFSVYDQFDDLAFVTGDHLEKFPLLGTVLQKLGAIVVNNCGGHEARKALAQSAAIAHQQGRKILIYPEGNLAKVGEKFRYRSGVWHMYRDFDMPVVPLATNLGLFWPQEDFRKNPGNGDHRVSRARFRRACPRPSSWPGWKTPSRPAPPNLSPRRPAGP